MMPIWRCSIALATGLAAVLSAGPAPARSRDNAPVPQPVQAVARHPISGLPVIDLTVSHGRRRHHFRVELARSFAEQEKGLMFRTAMAPDEGMIFERTDGQSASFWMKNTVIPLDIIFINLDGHVGNIAANAKPYDETPLVSIGPVKGVLELNGGRAARLRIRPGDTVTW